MKKILLVVLIAGTCSTIKAQETPVDVKFRRSSLHTMVVETDQFPKKEVVLNAFNNATIPPTEEKADIRLEAFCRIWLLENATLAKKSFITPSAAVATAPFIPAIIKPI